MVLPQFVSKSKAKFKRAIGPIIILAERTGLPPHAFTLFSFLFGILSVYFLFSNWGLFTLFSILAIFFDIIDGNLARRIGKVTKAGFYMDQLNDRIINFLLLLKYVIVFNQIGIIIPLFILHYGIFFLFKTRKVIYVRTVAVIFFILGGWFYQFYDLGVLISLILLVVGTVQQIFELINRYTPGKRYKPR